ncbi:MAG: patatin-like phospholipase family protein [Proteobacteria bacterium]|nr:patatin-like phospholipase family protein [Pseudomonadota bacterium]
MRVTGEHPPRRSGKIAVVCGGGGLTGGVFEVGALRALDTALGGGVVNAADCYAGASAGALVATMLAAGLTPQDMDDVIVRGARNRRRLPPLKRTSIYGMDLSMWLRSAGRLPLAMTRNFAASMMPGDAARPVDAFFDALGMLPPGLFTNEPLAEFVDTVLRRVGLPTNFEDLGKELLITAVNIDTGHRVVFGEAGMRDVPIGKAVQASAALPLLFRPVRIDEQDFIDGGIERNLPVDAVVQHGASLVIAVNPLVPVVNDPRSADGAIVGGGQYLSERGLPAILDQVFRMLIRSQVVYGLKAVRDKFPEVDIVMIEPEAHDWTMFSYHPMRYSVREKIAQHAFEMTRDRLNRDADHLTRVFARHDLDFDIKRLGKRRRRDKTRAAKDVFRRLERLPGLRNLVPESDAPDPF